MSISRNIIAKNLLSFILAAVIITLSFPETLKFKYEYAIGRPWNYELLTAPFSFDVYKSAPLLQHEKDSLARTVHPYYDLTPQVYIEAKKRLMDDYQKGRLDHLNSQYIAYILSTLEKIYEQGVISNEDNQLLQSNTGECYILNNVKVARKATTKELFTIVSAYDYILGNAPGRLDKEILKSANVNNYLQSNLQLNQDITDKVLQTKLADLSPTIGQIQEGEKIVNRGDIISYETSQILDSLKRVYETQTNSAREILLIRLGQFVISLLLLLSFFSYLYAFRPEYLKSIKNTLFFLILMVGFTILTQLSVNLEWINVFIIPYAIIAILTRTFFDSRTAFSCFLITVILNALLVPFAIEFIIVEFVAGMATVVTLRNLNQRSDLIQCTFFVLLSMIVTDLAFLLYRDGGITSNALFNTLFFAINFIFLMFSYVFVYIVERVFGYVSNVSLVELSNFYNSPLLRQLSEIAPGTAQHSQQVAILASEAASKIGADVQLIRTGALYHDIGKMRNPTYFTENQGETNPHDRLPYEESAKIIIRHVTDGIEMAEKAKLPSRVIDFIRTHHGLSRVKYFYNKFKNENPDRIIDESVFRYPGPNPFSKETGILMLADAVEASSRSLKELTEQKISNHINKIVDGIIDDGLLKNTPLTFRDVETIKQVFHDKLKTMYHSRISYPELKKKTASKNNTTAHNA